MRTKTYGVIILIRRLFLTLLLLLIPFFSACQKVTTSSADELTSRSWVCENVSGVCGKLSFEGSYATLIITVPQDNEGYKIEGVYAVDGDKLYITSEALSKTFEFSYDVYKDRVYISYEENTLEFRVSEY